MFKVEIWSYLEVDEIHSTAAFDIWFSEILFILFKRNEYRSFERSFLTNQVCELMISFYFVQL